MIAMATGCKKAGLFGLFLCLAGTGTAAPGVAETLLEKLQKGEQSAPPPAVPGQPGSRRRSGRA